MLMLSLNWLSASVYNAEDEFILNKKAYIKFSVNVPANVAGLDFFSINNTLLIGNPFPLLYGEFPECCVQLFTHLN